MTVVTVMAVVAMIVRALRGVRVNERPLEGVCRSLFGEVFCPLLKFLVEEVGLCVEGHVAEEGRVGWCTYFAEKSI